MEFCVDWFEVKNPGYSDYQRLIVDFNGSWHTHCSTAGDVNSEDEFIQKHFTGLRVIEFQKLSEVHHWPVGCGEGSNQECLLDYNYMVYVHPLLSIYDLPSIWWFSMGIAASSIVNVAVTKNFFFIDLDQIYSFTMCQVFFINKIICPLVRPLITQANPKIKSSVPLTPFFSAFFFFLLLFT